MNHYTLRDFKLITLAICISAFAMAFILSQKGASNEVIEGFLGVAGLCVIVLMLVMAIARKIERRRVRTYMRQYNH